MLDVVFQDRKTVLTKTIVCQEIFKLDVKITECIVEKHGAGQ